MLGPMTREELRAAIEKPAEAQGAAFEAGLVARLLDDVGEEPGNLPLLEFALTLLWERLDFGWMTHAAYEAIGRVEGALARYADEVYDGACQRTSRRWLAGSSRSSCSRERGPRTRGAWRRGPTWATRRGPWSSTWRTSGWW